MGMRVGYCAAIVLSFCNVASGQHLSYGVVVGTPLTADFNSYYFPSSGGHPTVLVPGSKAVIGGPMLEWKVSSHLSLEGDGVFRELRYQDLYAGPHNPTVTWEFPVLAKYRLSTGWPLIRPIVEAGPSFRTTGNLNENPSHVGISAGAGFELRLHGIDISPTLRYARWAQDSHPAGIQSRSDQVELLVGFSHTATSDSLPFGNRVSVGAVFGTNFLGDYNATSTSSSEVLSGTRTTFSFSSGPRSFLVGPAVEGQVSHHFSVEVDAVYKPVRQHYTNTRLISGQASSQSGDSSFATWQLPVLAKYELPVSLPDDQLRPFIEVGPSFRISGSVTHFGFTAGGGVSTKLGVLKIAPAIRYTRWQADSLGQVRSDEVDLLVGFTFGARR